MSDIHSCSLFCDRPECIKQQRDELRAEVERLRSRTVTLPPMPEPFFHSVARGGFLSTDGFTAEQMRNYAIAALRAAGVEVTP